MQKRFRIWQIFRCTRLYTNTRNSTTWRIADQTRTFICVFLQACAISQYTGNAFWKRNAKRLFAASQRWSYEFRVHVAEKDCVNWSLRNHSSEQLKVVPADRRWSVGRTPEMTWRSKRIETETSWRCHARSNARWILESSSLEALRMKTASRKLPKSLSLFRLSFFFFFLPFSLFFFFFFLPKSWPTSKWDQET